MATTGRLNSDKPNLQQIPHNSPEAERLRAAFRGIFKAPEGAECVSNAEGHIYDIYEKPDEPSKEGN